jgi:hypothetical protein
MSPRILALGLLSAFMLSAPTATSYARTFAFVFQNNTGQTINVAVYSKTRNLIWPSSERHWIIPPDGKRYMNYIACEANEYICYGGWPDNSDEIHWGAGMGGTQGCSKCCYYCRGNQTETINLIRVEHGD